MALTLRMHPRELMGEDYDGDDAAWLEELIEADKYLRKKQRKNG